MFDIDSLQAQVEILNRENVQLNRRLAIADEAVIGLQREVESAHRVNGLRQAELVEALSRVAALEAERDAAQETVHELVEEARFWINARAALEK